MNNVHVCLFYAYYMAYSFSAYGQCVYAYVSVHELGAVRVGGIRISYVLLQFPC